MSGARRPVAPLRRSACCSSPLFALSAASCGGDGGGGTTAAKERPRLTQAQFVAAGEQVCIRSDRRIYRIGSLGRDPVPWRKTRDAASTADRGDGDAAASGGEGEAVRSARRGRAAAPHRDRQVHDALVAKTFDKAREAQGEAVRADATIKRLAHALGLTFCEQLLTNWPA